MYFRLIKLYLNIIFLSIFFLNFIYLNEGGFLSKKLIQNFILNEIMNFNKNRLNLINIYLKSQYLIVNIVYLINFLYGHLPLRSGLNFLSVVMQVPALNLEGVKLTYFVSLNFIKFKLNLNLINLFSNLLKFLYNIVKYI